VSERLIFPTLFESLERRLGPQFGPQTRAALKAQGVDMNKLPPAIPAVQAVNGLRIIAAHAWPEENATEQLRKLGYEAIIGWSDGLLGRAVTGMLKVIGPRRTLNRLDRAFATADNFSHATTEFLGEADARVTVNDVSGIPPYWQGIFEAGLVLLSLKGLVAIEPSPAPSGVFRCRWN
jgi:uncharacterized protein (TIGR02265 family)